MKDRHSQECDNFGKLSITGHYYYHDRGKLPLDFDDLVDTSYKSRHDVGYFWSEDEVINHFNDKIIDKSKGYSIEVSSCTKTKPYRRSTRPYQPGYIEMLKVSIVLNEEEISYVILHKG